MPDLIEPNAHPFIVHFVVAFLLTAPLLLLVSALSPAGAFKSSTQSAGDWMLGLGVILAAAAIAAGLQAYYSVAHDAPSHAAMTDHRNFAFATGAVFFALGLWRFTQRKAPPTFLFAALLLGAATLLAVTGWKGGRLVYHHGLGVASLPQAEGEGHSHDHGDAANGSAEAHDHGAESGAAAAEASSVTDADLASLSPGEIVEAFHASLAAGDVAMVQKILDPGVLIFESGGAERSFDEYAGHHLPADIEFSKSVSSTLNSQKERIAGSMASVFSERMAHGEFRGRKIHARTLETMILSKSEGGWRISHIHWSSADVDEDHEH